VISSGSRPPIIIDWTAVTPNLWALVAAVSFKGRALTIYAETHPISRYLKPYVHSAFLRRLSKVLPPRCAPVVLADAGFRSPFMKLVEKMDWDYVIRLRGPVVVRHKFGRGWRRLPYLFGELGSWCKDFGRAEIGRRVRFVTRLVGVRRAVRHRKYHSRQRHSSITWRYKREAYEPWVLATSVGVESSRVIALYARRMQIEETFRDAKNPRFGMSLAFSRPRSPERADILLLLASLAHLLALLVGIAAENANLQRGFQANTVVSKRVISLVMLGRFLFSCGNEAVMVTAFSRTAWSSLRVRVAEGLRY
jgi:hypothetical protein